MVNEPRRMHAPRSWISASLIVAALCLLGIGSMPGVLALGPPATPASSRGAAYEVSWTSRAPMPTARGWLAAVTGNNGKIYAMGGQVQPAPSPDAARVATNEEYNSASDTWTTRANMPTARWNHSLATAPDGRIWAIGGSNGSADGGIVEVYDPVTDSWQARASMPGPGLNSGGAVWADDGKLYVVDARAVQQYDPSTDTWTSRATLPTYRYNFGMAINGEKIFVIGGTGVGRSSLPSAVVEAYDPATNAWSTRQSLPVPMGSVSAITGPNGQIHAIGGTSVYAYDPALDAWYARADLPTYRVYLGAATGPTGKLCAIGGWDSQGHVLNTVEEGTISGTQDLPPTPVPCPTIGPTPSATPVTGNQEFQTYLPLLRRTSPGFCL